MENLCLIEDFKNLNRQLNNDKIMKETLQKDRKFDAVFDDNLMEFESFYIILQSFLRQSIGELNEIMRRKIDGLDVLSPPLEGVYHK